MSASPRLCHLITTWYDRAASPRRTLEIILGLKNLGYEIDLMVGQEGSKAFLDSVQSQGIRVWRVPGLQKFVSPGKDLRALWALKKKFRQNRYDLVHTYLPKAGILGRLAARWAGVPFIVHTIVGPSPLDSNSWLGRKIFLQLERLTARFTQATVYVGEELRQRYLTAGIGTPEKSQVIYTGRNFSHFLKARSQSTAERQRRRKLLGFQANDLIVGYVARVVPSKGHIYAIEAAEKLIQKFPRLRFLFIGEANVPKERKYKLVLLSEIEKRRLQERVVFLDYQPDIENYYAIFDIFIFPSLYEGLPNVILEASVMGLPIVTFDCGGVREILGNYSLARVIPLKNVEEFSRQLEEALVQIQSNAHSKVWSDHLESLLKKWSIETMIEAQDRLYRELFRGEQQLYLS